LQTNLKHEIDIPKLQIMIQAEYGRFIFAMIGSPNRARTPQGRSNIQDTFETAYRCYSDVTYREFVYVWRTTIIFRLWRSNSAGHRTFSVRLVCCDEKSRASLYPLGRLDHLDTIERYSRVAAGAKNCGSSRLSITSRPEGDGLTSARRAHPMAADAQRCL